MQRPVHLKRTWLAFLALTLVAALLPLSAAAFGSATLRFSPQPLAVEMGQVFTVDVLVDDVVNLAGAQVYVDFDPSILEVQSVVLGSLWGLESNTYKMISHSNATGEINFQVALLSVPPVSGSGPLARITFRAKGVGKSGLQFAERVLDVVPFPTLLSDGNAQEIPTTKQNGEVTTYQLSRVEILPKAGTVTAGEVVMYRAEVYDSQNVLRGVVTGGTAFSIDEAAGAMQGAVMVAEKAGSWTVEGVYHSPGGKTLVGQATLTVNPGPPATVVLDSLTQTVAPGQTLVITATVLDAYGNPVADGTAITAAANRGGFANGQATYQGTTTGGQVQIVFRAPATTDPTMATVTVSSGNAAASLQVMVRPGGAQDEAIYLPLVMAPLSA